MDTYKMALFGMFLPSESGTIDFKKTMHFIRLIIGNIRGKKVRW